MTNSEEKANTVETEEKPVEMMTEEEKAVAHEKQKNAIYEQVKQFKKKYPWTVAWRIRQHCEVMKSHLNPNEKIRYVFIGQKGDNPFDIFDTYLCVLTNKRLLFGKKRIIYGYFFLSVTPDLFNDIKVKKRLFWGLIKIDTLKERVLMSNIDKRALVEIETNVSEYMIKEKKRYGLQQNQGRV